MGSQLTSYQAFDFLDGWGHTLHRRRRYFDDLDRCVAELISETENECVQGSFRGRVGGEGCCGDDGEVGTGAIVVSQSLNSLLEIGAIY